MMFYYFKISSSLSRLFGISMVFHDLLFTSQLILLFFAELCSALSKNYFRSSSSKLFTD